MDGSDLPKLDLPKLDLLASQSQIDGVCGRRGGDRRQAVKHPLGVIEGATENAATVRARLDNLIGRGLDPDVCRLFMVDGAKRARKHFYASVRRTLRQAWEMEDAEKAEKSIRNLAKRLEQEALGMSALACPPNGAGRWPAPISSRT